MKKLICLVLSLATLLCMVVPVAAGFNEPSYEIDMDEYELGFRVSMPSSYTVYPSFEDKTLEDLRFFFDSSNTPDFSMPGYSLNTGYEVNSADISSFDNLTEEQCNLFLDDVFAYTLECYGANVGDRQVSLQTVNINGNIFLRADFSASGGGGRTAFFSNYYIVINGLLIRFSAIAFTADGDPKYAEEVAALGEQFVSTVVVTGETAAATDAQLNGSSSPSSDFLSFEFPTWIFLAVFALILLIGIKFSKRGEWQSEPLSLENSKCIQGFCAISIILHHMSQTITFAGKDPGALSILVDAGVLFVGIFFFFSGYGLSKSLHTKKDYLKGFLGKRLPSVLVPFFSCVAFFVIANSLMGRKFGGFELLNIFTGVYLINSHMWYMVEIFILYIAFFLIFKFIKNEKAAFATISVFCAAIVVYGIFAGHGNGWFMGEWWFNTTMLFVVGLFFARFENELLEFAKNNYIKLLPICLLLFVGFAFLNSFALENYSYYADKFSAFVTLSAQLPMVIFFVLSLVLIMLKVKFSNPVLKFLGTISLEVYLLHNFFIENLRSSQFLNVRSNSLYVALVLLCAIAIATLVSGFDKYLVALITKKKSLSISSGKKIHSIDGFRLIAAFLVVVIHIPFSNMDATGIIIAFGKTAVPFFLVVCGYFLWRDDVKDFVERLKKQAKKILLLTIAANVIYTLIALVQCLSQGGTLSMFAKTSLTRKNLENFFIWNMSPFGDHLWYLGSLLYALIILIFLCKLGVHKKAMFFAPVLLGGYIALSWTLDPTNYFMYRNALLCTLPYVLLGCMIARYREKLMAIKLPWYLGAFALLCVTNVLEYNLYHGNLGVPFFSAELLVYVIVLILLKLPSLFEGTIVEKLGRDCSLFVYIMHIAVLIGLTLIPFNLPFMDKFQPIIVFVVTILLALVWNLLKRLIKKKKPEEK